MDMTTKPLETETETETETPIKIQHIKPLSFTNGVLKRHPLPHIVTYKECLKNHAASLGGHAVDGCGEFMPSPNSNQNEPSSLKCAACGCHRNFHRRDPDEPPPNTTVIEYQPHHRHHPPPPPQPKHPITPNSTSPPPISSTYYPSVSHSQMLIAITSPSNETNSVQNGRKRFRTKFTQHQKDKMYEFAERVGWKMQKTDEDLTFDFCRQIGVDKNVLKVWMHNNKSTLGKRDTDFSNVNGSQNGFDHVTQNNTLNCVSDPHVVTTNGSSSSS